MQGVREECAKAVHKGHTISRREREETMARRA